MKQPGTMVEIRIGDIVKAIFLDNELIICYAEEFGVDIVRESALEALEDIMVERRKSFMK